MSANITNTSDPRAAGRPAIELANDAGAAPGLPTTIASPPDPAVIARLANELFAALPWSPSPAAPAGTGSAGDVPQGLGSVPSAKTDVGGLPASPTGAAALVPANPAAVPVQGAPASPATALSLIHI